MYTHTHMSQFFWLISPIFKKKKKVKRKKETKIENRNEIFSCDSSLPRHFSFGLQSSPLLSLLLHKSAFTKVTTFPWFPFLHMFLIEVELYNFLSPFLPSSLSQIPPHTHPTPPPVTFKLIASISLIITVTCYLINQFLFVCIWL